VEKTQNALAALEPIRHLAADNRQKMKKIIGNETNGS